MQKHSITPYRGPGGDDPPRQGGPGGAAPLLAAGGVLRKRLLYGLAAGLAGLVVAWLLSLTGIVISFEARTFDWRARLMAPEGPPSDAVRLILLDQGSLDWGARENGLSWPWPREVYGVILDFCRRAGAKAVAFDVLYTEPSTYGVADDAALAEAGKRLGNFALPVFLGRESGQSGSWPGDVPADTLPLKGLESWLAGVDPAEAPVFPKAAFPVPEVAAGARILGNVSQEPEFDGVYRKVGLFGVFDGKAVPSLSLAARMLAEPGMAASIAGQSLSLGPVTVPLDDAGRCIPRWRKSSDFPALSAAAVIQSELALREGGEPVIDPATLRGRYVLFGFSAPGLLDLRPSPVAGVTSGVEIHAQALQSMLTGDFLRVVPHWAGWWLAGALAVAGAALVSLSSGAAAMTAAIVVFAPLPLALALGGYALGWWLPLALPEAAVAAALVVAVVASYATEGRQKRFIKSAFKQYLSPDVIEALIAHPERMALGGELRELTIFFSDLQGFTTISEGLSPQALTALLNKYLTAMTDIILEEGGTVDKYEGDAIIAFWNAPLDQPDHAARAVRAALRCQDRLAELRPDFRELSGHDLFMRVGLNTGQAVVGNMGSDSRFDYTMLGDAVNLASRLEGVNKQFGTYTMMSAATREAAGEAFAARRIALVEVVGRAEAVTVCEPLWPRAAEEGREALDAFAAALEAFIAGDFPAAREGFSALAPNDAAAASYVERCRRLIADPPSGEWTGVCKMTSK
ncbi:adenylate/guanylate cyclase domain-containing protein [Solidesulfovibrio sp.]|uniref:CHASE2 domain-containing protein n=1 Tax=Solidesulfovibrio sp. TaxID=2910990 RepID=UPI00261EE86E|nr:adenylate/guanylate cyclase domain-containing protein [Solidesulfovibrio sp.]